MSVQCSVIYSLFVVYCQCGRFDYRRTNVIDTEMDQWLLRICERRNQRANHVAQRAGLQSVTVPASAVVSCDPVWVNGAILFSVKFNSHNNNNNKKTLPSPSCKQYGGGFPVVLLVRLLSVYSPRMAAV